MQKHVRESAGTAKKQNALLAAIKDQEIALQSSIKKTMEDKLQHILSHQDLVSMAYDYHPSSAKTLQKNAASAMGQKVCLQTDQILKLKIALTPFTLLCTHLS